MKALLLKVEWSLLSPSAAVPMTTIAGATNFTTYMCQDKIVASTTNIKKPTVPQTIQTDNNSFQSHSFISKTPPFRTGVTLQRERTKKSMFKVWKTQPWIRHNFPGESCDMLRHEKDVEI